MCCDVSVIMTLSISLDRWNKKKLQITNYKVMLGVHCDSISCEGGILQYRTESVSCESVLLNVIVSCEGRQLQSLNVSNTSSRNCVRGLV